MVSERKRMSVAELSERTDAFVAEVSAPLEQYSADERALSQQLGDELKQAYAHAFVDLMRKQYLIVDVA
jgi:hypothetical protein